MLTVHLSIAILTLLLVLYSDEQAFAWMRGKVEVLQESKVRTLHYLVSAGLAFLILSGGYMYAQAAPAFLSVSTFVLKMGLIFALIANSHFIETLSHIATTRSFASLTPKERLPLFVTGAVSTFCWASIFICGLILVS